MFHFQYSDELANRIKDYLDEEDYKYVFDTDMGVLRMPINVGGLCGMLKHNIVVYETEYMVSVQPAFHVNPADTATFNEMAKLLCLINYNLKYGSISMDLKGNIRHNYSVECTNCMPSREVLERSIWSAALCFKRNEDAIYHILSGEMTAEQVEAETDTFKPTEEEISVAQPLVEVDEEFLEKLINLKKHMSPEEYEIYIEPYKALLEEML